MQLIVLFFSQVFAFYLTSRICDVAEPQSGEAETFHISLLTCVRQDCRCNPRPEGLGDDISYIRCQVKRILFRYIYICTLVAFTDLPICFFAYINSFFPPPLSIIHLFLLISSVSRQTFPLPIFILQFPLAVSVVLSCSSCLIFLSCFLLSQHLYPASFL